MLYAQDRYSILIIFQAMDAAGKDGTIKHVMSGINPQRMPSIFVQATFCRGIGPRLSLAYQSCLPERGESEFSTVLTMKTCLSPKCIPKLYCPTNLPGVETIKDIDSDFGNAVTGKSMISNVI